MNVEDAVKRLKQYDSVDYGGKYYMTYGGVLHYFWNMLYEDLEPESQDEVDKMSLILKTGFEIGKVIAYDRKFTIVLSKEWSDDYLFEGLNIKEFFKPFYERHNNDELVDPWDYLGGLDLSFKKHKKVRNRTGRPLVETFCEHYIERKKIVPSDVNELVRFCKYNLPQGFSMVEMKEGNLIYKERGGKERSYKMERLKQYFDEIAVKQIVIEIFKPH